MAYRITGTEVRNRLRSLTSTELTDTVLDDLAFIAGAEAVMNQILANNSKSYSSLDADQKTLVKLAQIELCCEIILSDYPEDGWETGPIKFKPMGAEQRQKMIENFHKRAEWYLSLIGCTMVDVYVSSSGGDDYMPDGDDDTMIDFTDEDEDTFSLWG